MNVRSQRALVRYNTCRVVCTAVQGKHRVQTAAVAGTGRRMGYGRQEVPRTVGRLAMGVAEMEVVAMGAAIMGVVVM